MDRTQQELVELVRQKAVRFLSWLKGEGVCEFVRDGHWVAEQMRSLGTLTPDALHKWLLDLKALMDVLGTEKAWRKAGEQARHYYDVDREDGSDTEPRTLSFHMQRCGALSPSQEMELVNLARVTMPGPKADEVESFLRVRQFNSFRALHLMNYLTFLAEVLINISA